VEKNRRFFEVTPDVDVSVLHINEDDLISELMNDGDLRDEALRSEPVVADEEALMVDLTPWLRRTNWLRTFKGKVMDTLVELARLPGQDEPKLQLVSESVQRVITQRCVDSVTDISERGWNLIPFLLNSTDPTAPNSSPFKQHYDKRTIPRYAQSWARLICLCLRAVNTDGHDVEFTDAQEQCVYDLREMVELGAPMDKELDDKVMDLSALLIMHDDYEERRSVIKYYTGILGFNSTSKQWQRPNEYTPKLAELQCCMRLIMMEHSIPTCMRGEYRRHFQKPPHEEFCKYRTKWLVTGTPSPFNYIHTLMNYGLKAAKDAPGPDHIRWSSDSRIMYFDGKGLHVDQWIQMIETLTDELESSLRVLQFLPPDSVIPDVDLYDVYDNPNNHDVDHYFALNDTDGVKDARRRMLQNLRAAGHLHKWIQVDTDGIKSYSQHARSEYEKKVARFLELMWLLLNFTCGVTGRGTEVLGLRYKNTMASDRNVFIEDGQLMFVTQMHKSVAITDDLKVRAVLMCNFNLGDSTVPPVPSRTLSICLSPRYHCIPIPRVRCVPKARIHLR
jgi:hypothetical protein